MKVYLTACRINLETVYWSLDQTHRVKTLVSARLRAKNRNHWLIDLSIDLREAIEEGAGASAQQ